MSKRSLEMKRAGIPTSRTGKGVQMRNRHWREIKVLPPEGGVRYEPCALIELAPVRRAIHRATAAAYLKLDPAQQEKRPFWQFARDFYTKAKLLVAKAA